MSRYLILPPFCATEFWNYCTVVDLGKTAWGSTYKHTRDGNDHGSTAPKPRQFLASRIVERSNCSVQARQTQPASNTEKNIGTAPDEDLGPANLEFSLRIWIVGLAQKQVGRQPITRKLRVAACLCQRLWTAQL